MLTTTQQVCGMNKNTVPSFATANQGMGGVNVLNLHGNIGELNIAPRLVVPSHLYSAVHREEKRKVDDRSGGNGKNAKKTLSSDNVKSENWMVQNGVMASSAHLLPSHHPQQSQSYLRLHPQQYSHPDLTSKVNTYLSKPIVFEERCLPELEINSSEEIENVIENTEGSITNALAQSYESLSKHNPATKPIFAPQQSRDGGAVTTNPFIELEEDDTKVSPESVAGFYFFNEALHCSIPNLQVNGTAMKLIRPTSAPPIRSQRNEQTNHVVGNSYLPMHLHPSPCCTYADTHTHDRSGHHTTNGAASSSNSPSVVVVNDTTCSIYDYGMNFEKETLEEPMVLDFQKINTFPFSSVILPSEKFRHSNTEPPIRDIRPTSQGLLLNRASSTILSNNISKNPYSHHGCASGNNDILVFPSLASQQLRTLLRPVTAPPPQTLSGLVASNVLANLGSILTSRNNAACMASRDTLNENTEAYRKIINKNIFTINGVKGNKKFFLRQMKNNKIGLDSRILKQLRCNLLDLVEESSLVLPLCQDKYGSRYFQKLLDDRNIPIKHFEMLITLLCTNNISVQLAQHVSGNYVIQKLLEIFCENVYRRKEIATPTTLPDRNTSTKSEEMKNKNENERELGKEESTKEFNNHNNASAKVSNALKMNSLRNEKLIQLGKTLLHYMFAGNVEEMSMNHYSCRIIQRVLRYENAEYLEIKKVILSQIDIDDKCLYEFIQHPFRNHVLQKCIECIPNEYLGTICKLMEGRVCVYAMHVYGCRVIQRLMQYCTLAQLRPIYKEILNHVVEMCINQYANYVVQMMLELCKDTNLTNELINIISSKIDIVCPEKFASNVVEFCLTKCGEIYQKKILDTLLYDYNKKHPNKPILVADLVRNEYGNYVIQTVAQVSMLPKNVQYRDDLIHQIQENVPRTDLMKYPWGKYVTRRIEQLTEYTTL